MYLSSEVFKAKDKKTNKKFVAMKKVLMENEKEGVSFHIIHIILILTNYCQHILLHFCDYKIDMSQL